MNVTFELAEILSWRSLVVVLVLFGVAPGLALRLVVRLYPKGDLRRRELVAELYVQPYLARLLWVAQQMETACTEGIAARWHSRQARGVEPDTEEATILYTSNYDRLMEAALAERSTPLDVGEWEKTLKGIKESAGHQPEILDPLIEGVLVARMAAFNMGFFQAESRAARRRWFRWLRRTRRHSR